MNPVLVIAKAEWAWWSRSRLARLSAFIFLSLLGLAVLTSTVYLHEQVEHRQANQAQATDIFEDQPDRHPHRMVHYGQYVFRAPPPLASIDPGLDAYGGTSLFLEGHRKNATMFAAAKEGSTLVRFGNLTPAFCLQVLAPLLLILLGHAAMTREQESSTLKVLLAQGVSLRQIAAGKLLVLLVAVFLCVCVLAAAAFVSSSDVVAQVFMVLVYSAYLGIWALLIVTASCLSRRSNSVFLTLTALWMLSTLVVPRLAADVANTLAPLESAFAREMQLNLELRALGDSHNTADPNYRSFMDKVLEDYGVETPEELPVNIRGLLAVEGERQGAEVLERFNRVDQNARLRQQTIFAAAGVLSPTVSLQLASQSIAGTDLSAYHRFLDEAEAHRIAFVQALNMLQATDVNYSLDKLKSIDVQAERVTRVSAEAWKTLPKFSFQTAATSERLKAAAMSIFTVGLWLACAVCVFLWATRRRAV